MKQTGKGITLEEIEQFCIIDRKPISMDRIIRRCVTCSPECERKKKKQRNAIINSRRCLHCFRPSTPEDREQYRRFKAWLRQQGLVAVPKIGRRPKKPVDGIPKTV